MANTEIDYMEYSSDANAQAAYVSNSSSYDSYTKLASHFDGADAAIAYTDPIAGAATFVGTAQLDTAQYKFATASLLLNGNSDYVTYPDSDSWNFGTGDFTIDFWVRFNSVASNQTFISQSTDGNNWVKFAWETSNALYCQAYTASSQVTLIGCSWTPVADTWYHIAYVMNGSTPYIFVDGVSKTLPWNTVGTFQDLTGVLNIGRQSSNTSNYVNGWIDEVRISKGIARWTTNFTPDTVAYPVQSGFILQSFSESTIKTQGSYSLKGIAAATDSLNKTLTRTVSPTIDLSDQTQIKLSMYSSRTGSNVKIGFHDSGGTTTEYTSNITSAGEFQTFTVDISGVSNANKDAIDSIIITQINADSATTWYLDNIYGTIDAGIIFIPKIMFIF